MEFKNRLHIVGIVGRSEINTFNNKQVCNFSVVTEYSTVDREGNPMVESTWFNVSAWAGRDNIIDLYSIQKGCWVELTGRIRMRKYLTQENEERTALEVIARSVKLVERDDERMQPQRD